MTSVVVFDYGFGNVRSMVRALANLDLDVTLTSDHRQGMEGLKSVGGDTVIKDRLRAGRPVLGVCVGEQIMFERGMEHGTGTPGLGLIKGDVELLDADVVPHMGWDTVEAPEGYVLMKGVTWCTYGRSRFVAAYERGPLFATQFHPEKSAEAGSQLLRNWVATF